MRPRKHARIIFVALVPLNEIHEWLALWDKKISTVSIPESLGGALLDNPSDPEMIETVCYSRLAEPFMVEKYKLDEEYWAQYDIQPSWTYFGAHNGLFRKIPAVHQEVCGDMILAVARGLSLHQVVPKMCYWS